MRIENLDVEKLNLKKIKGFEEYYISPSGEVWSYKNKPHCPKGWKKLTDWVDKKGYHWIRLVDGDRKMGESIHRLVAFAFCEGYFEGAVVNHKDGNTHNNHYTNLEWCTQKHNVNESYKTSGINQVRNYKYFTLIYPDGTKSEEFKGFAQFEKFIKDNELNTSALSLRAYGRSKDYKCIQRNK